MGNQKRVLKDINQMLLNFVREIGKEKELMKVCKKDYISNYEQAVRHFPMEEAKSITGASEHRIFKLKTCGRCNSSFSKNCLKLNPTQLCISEQDTLRYYLYNEEYKHLYTNYIWAIAKREGLCMSLNTFYKYAEKMGRLKKEPKEKRKLEIESPKANYPFQILHMDSTFYRCANGERVFIHFIQDNFSRKILSGVVLHSTQSEEVAQALMKVITENKLQDRPVLLYCDDGPENKKYVNELIEKNNFKIKKVIANYSTRKSNNMIEAWNKTFKRSIINRYERIENEDDLKSKLPEILDYFNNLYNPNLNALSPNEVAKGKTQKDLQNEMLTRKNLQKRIEANRCLECELKECEDYSLYDCKKILDEKKKNKRD